MTLVDTGPLVALCDPRDALHKTARKHLQTLARSGLRVCEAVVTEACFHLPHTVQRERLRALLHELRIETLPTHDQPFQADVFDWLIKFGDQEPDWADGCIAVLVGEDPRLKVWTYDAEFRTTWRQPDGRAIPLAVK